MFLQLVQSTNRELPKLLCVCVCESRRIRVRGDPQGSAQQQGQPAWPADAHIHPPGPPAQCVHRGGHSRLRSHHSHHNGETVSNTFLPSCKSVLHQNPVILHNDKEWKSSTSIPVGMDSDYIQIHYPNSRASVAMMLNYFTNLVHFYKLNVVTLWNSFPCIYLNIQQIGKLFKL